MVYHVVDFYVLMADQENVTGLYRPKSNNCH